MNKCKDYEYRCTECPAPCWLQVFGQDYEDWIPKYCPFNGEKTDWYKEKCTEINPPKDARK